MSTRFGAVVANSMGAVAKVIGYGMYYLLRIIYRRRDKMIAAGVLAAIVAVLAAWWVLA